MEDEEEFRIFDSEDDLPYSETGWYNVTNDEGCEHKLHLLRPTLAVDWNLVRPVSETEYVRLYLKYAGRLEISENEIVLMEDGR